jgi:hypothetical protein
MVVGPTIHCESTLERVPVPPIEWGTAREHLHQILMSHEETPAEGSRFLIANTVERSYESCPCYPRMVHIDYMMTRENTSWSYHVSVWSHHNPYTYDYDVSEMRPFIDLN